MREKQGTSPITSDFDEIAQAARRVIADGLALTGENLAAALSVCDEPADLGPLVSGVLDGFTREPDPGFAVIDIGDVTAADVRREIERQGQSAIILDWPFIDMSTLLDIAKNGRDAIIVCHLAENIDDAWEAIDSAVEASAVPDQAVPGFAGLSGIDTDGHDLREKIEQITSRLASIGLSVAGPGVCGAELESLLPVPGADHPSIKLVDGESITAVEEARESASLDFAVIVYFDSAHPERINPDLGDLA